MTAPPLACAALEVIIEMLDMPQDIAGATLMAAGGSAPELFTAFIGTFQKSSVGLGTIVGSGARSLAANCPARPRSSNARTRAARRRAAVFNVLFVIAACALASTEVLVVTWWCERANTAARERQLRSSRSKQSARSGWLQLALSDLLSLNAILL